MEHTPEAYRAKLKIDKHSLDEELIRQPVLFGRVAMYAAHALSVRDAAYDNRKVIEAELQIRLRRKHDDAEEKYTEKSIEAEMLKHSERQEAVQQLNAADLELNEWTAVKEAFVQRSYALKDLCGLHISGYFQDTAVKAPQQQIKEQDYQDNRKAMQAKRSKG